MGNIERSSSQISLRGDTLSVQLIRPRIDQREVVLSFDNESNPGEFGQAIRDRSGHSAGAVQRVIDLAGRRHRQHQDGSEEVKPAPNLKLNFGRGVREFLPA
jgi:hypothetical protein